MTFPGGADTFGAVMRIVLITPGAGAMYCGNCLRDNALARALRALGHDVLMLPVYLPLTLDEPDLSAQNRIFYSGVNVYLDQQLPFFRRAPALLRRLLSARPLLRLAAGRAAKTRPEEVGDLALSMLRGELGSQARDLDELTNWLETQPRPDAVILSNALLLGMARQIKGRLGAKIVCQLGGEDSFLDALPEPFRQQCWAEVAARGRDVDRFLAPTRYFARLMCGRIGLNPEQVSIVPNGINLEGFRESNHLQEPPVLGFFTRMSREKGLETLVRAFIRIRKSPGGPKLRLKVGGSCGPTDEPLVERLRREIAAAGLAEDVRWHPNLSRDEKIGFLESLSIFSAPATYGEAFGLYVIEAMSAGVPVVQPDTASFPELIEATGGGVLCRVNDVESLAEEIGRLAAGPERRKALGAAGRKAVIEKFSADAMARGVIEAIA